jgi:prolyl-tRNA synthetase
MLQSKIFTKTKKEAPRDEVSKNAQLLTRGGFVHKEMAGVYSYLPLGLRVLKKIENIIREEMNAIGGQEVLMTTLQDPKIWEKSGRWDDEIVDNWFKTELKNGEELGVGMSHEEPLTNLLKEHISSYKDIPKYIYQIQTKFRNELRAKSGLMRVREFLMKDLYSFNKSEEDFREFYEKCANAYTKIFDRLGIGEVTYRTLAAGGSFTVSLTDEFQTLSDAGEDIIYIDKEKKIAINKEVYTDENIKNLGLDKSKLEEKKSIEVGNIFPLGTKYSEALGLKYKDENGENQTPIMGSYGIGLGRVLATIAEVFADENGLIWPESVAPFKFHIVALDVTNNEVRKTASEIHRMMENSNIEVLYDDRDKTPGEKFAESDLLGIPYRIVISERNLKEGMLEIKDRKTGEVKKVNKDETLRSLLGEGA